MDPKHRQELPAADRRLAEAADLLEMTEAKRRLLGNRITTKQIPREAEFTRKQTKSRQIAKAR
jgi:hypothetical protein